jgi:molybdenum cofactor cytidylyltransferase
VLFDRAMFSELREIAEETQGIRAVMRRHASSTLTVELADPGVHLDLNTPADVEAFRRRR